MNAVTRRGAVAAMVIATPVLVGIGYSAAAAVGLAGPAATGFSLARIVRVLTEPAVWESVRWTAWVAVASTALATLGAIVVALTFRTEARGDRWARALALVPLPLPHLAAAVAGLLLLGQSGLLARIGAAIGLFHAPADLMPLVYDRAGIGLILTLAWKELPFLALVAFAVLQVQSAQYEEVARSLGARAGQVAWRVTLPLLWRGLLPAIVAVLVFVAGAYEPAAVLAPSDPMPLAILTMERTTAADLARRGDAHVLVLLTLSFALLAAVLHEWARGRWERVDA